MQESLNKRTRSSLNEAEVSEDHAAVMGAMERNNGQLIYSTQDDAMIKFGASSTFTAFCQELDDLAIPHTPDQNNLSVHVMYKD